MADRFTVGTLASVGLPTAAVIIDGDDPNLFANVKCNCPTCREFCHRRAKQMNAGTCRVDLLVWTRRDRMEDYS